MSVRACQARGHAPPAIFEAAIVRLRIGCPWSGLPRQHPGDSTVHDFQCWVERGVPDRVCATIQKAREDFRGCDREWRAAVGWLGKARLVEDMAPTPRIGPSAA